MCKSPIKADDAVYIEVIIQQPHADVSFLSYYVVNYDVQEYSAIEGTINFPVSLNFRVKDNRIISPPTLYWCCWFRFKRCWHVFLLELRFSPWPGYPIDDTL